MKGITRLIALLAVLVGLALATGVAYAAQVDSQLVSNAPALEDDEMVVITGTVTSITTETIVVDETAITLTAETIFVDEVVVSDTVRVEAYYAEDGGLVATKIELCDGDDDVDDEYFKIIGTVTSVTTDTLVVDETTIAVTDETIFKDEIAVDDVVKVIVFYAEDGTLTAYKVSLYEDKGTGPGYGYDVKIKIVGLVESYYTDTIVVAGTSISITAETEIIGEIEVGDVVSVHAYITEDGVITAWKIQLLPGAVADPGNGDKIKVIGGVVDSLTSDAIVVSGVEFAITDETIIKGDVEVGDFVDVHAYVSEDGILTASRIVEVRGCWDGGIFSRGGDSQCKHGESHGNPDKGNPDKSDKGNPDKSDKGNTKDGNDDKNTSPGNKNDNNKNNLKNNKGGSHK